MSEDLKRFLVAILCIVIVGLAIIFGCKIAFGTAGGVNFKLFRQANDFDIYRRITVMNTRTDEIMLQMEGYIALNDNDSEELVVTMQTGDNDYIKHYIYLNEWTCYAVEQTEPDPTAANEILYYPRLCGGDHS